MESMTPRERQLATLRHEETDRISVDAICVENTQEIAAYLGIGESEVLARLGLDGRINAPGGYTGVTPRAPDGTPLSIWGTSVSDDYGTAHISPLACAETVAEVEQYPWWPDPNRHDYGAFTAWARDAVGTYATRGPYWKTLFCQSCELLGMEEAMMKMACQPNVYDAILARIFDYTYEYCRLMLDDAGDALDILYLGDDFASQRGLMISPAQWRAHLKPLYAKLFALGKDRGKFVWFHSCGDITAVLPDLIDIGVDVWETVQLHTLPMSPEALKREYGAHLTFFGAVSTQSLPFATLQEVTDEVRRCISVLAKGGGYICGPDHHIKPDVPAANAVALFDTAREYTGYGQRRRTD